ncbi:nucleoside-diphosphate kinase [Candidatus Woesearchaeota archaeon]|nr:nucleoside-diphosphate kinase [Candidatus Woesearchaeota archaeon]
MIMIERTLVLIKSDGVLRGIVGEVIRRFENAGMKIVGMKMVWVNKKFAEEHYKIHSKKQFFKTLVNYITEGPVVATVIEGVHAVDNVRKIVGSTSPSDAAPGTIRGDYSHMSMAHADKNKKAGKNIIHASDKSQTAKKEIALWFDKKELHTYKTVHEKHVF